MCNQILVSSHESYAEVTIPPLMRSCTAAGIPHENITIVVAGGAPRSLHKIAKCISYPHNSFEWTSLQAALEHDFPGDSFMMLHDTCAVSPLFWKCVQEVSPAYDFVSVDPEGWTNMGVYTRSWIENNAWFLRATRGMTKERAHMSERLPYRMAKNPSSMSRSTFVERGVANVYGRGVPRLVVEWPAIGLKKYMANHMRATQCYLEP